jgi:hypothetical protein
LAVDADHITQVKALRQGKSGIAHLGFADHHLDRAGPIADLKPMDLARGATEHNSPRGANRRAMLLRRLARLAVVRWLDSDFSFAGANLADGLMPVEAVPPGVDSQLLYFVQFIATGGL